MLNSFHGATRHTTRSYYCRLSRRARDLLGLGHRRWGTVAVPRRAIPDTSPTPRRYAQTTRNGWERQRRLPASEPPDLEALSRAGCHPSTSATDEGWGRQGSVVGWESGGGWDGSGRLRSHAQSGSTALAIILCRGAVTNDGYSSIASSNCTLSRRHRHSSGSSCDRRPRPPDVFDDRWLEFTNSGNAAERYPFQFSVPRWLRCQTCLVRVVQNTAAVYCLPVSMREIINVVDNSFVYGPMVTIPHPLPPLFAKQESCILYCQSLCFNMHLL